MLDKIADAVKAGIYMAGGTPFEISTIGVCDGIAMNHAGMRARLPSREVIADSVELAVSAHAFDAVVLIPNCDKVIPGMLMAAARLDIPTVVISGGPMLAGRGPKGEAVDLDTVFTAVGKVTSRRDVRGGPARARGARLPDVRQLRRAVHRQLDELPHRGDRHRPAGQRHHPRGLLGAHPARQAGRHAGHGAARAPASPLARS